MMSLSPVLATDKELPTLRVKQRDHEIRVRQHIFQSTTLKHSLLGLRKGIIFKMVPRDPCFLPHDSGG